jgi:hypothetical protein
VFYQGDSSVKLLEDLAVGSVLAALAAYRVAITPEDEADIRPIIEQSVHMGQPSTRT